MIALQPGEFGAFDLGDMLGERNRRVLIHDPGAPAANLEINEHSQPRAGAASGVRELVHVRSVIDRDQEAFGAGVERSKPSNFGLTDDRREKEHARHSAIGHHLGFR